MKKNTIFLSLLISISSSAELSLLISPKTSDAQIHQTGHASFAELVQVMRQNPYDENKLPVIPIQIFKWIGNQYNFFVGARSHEILNDKRDYRLVGMEKPIHPMGVGLTGRMVIRPTQWSGLFRGGDFLVVARASISQGNPFKFTEKNEMQVRSTAMGIKVFSSADINLAGPTANAVFQNNLNGLLGDDGKPLNYLQSPQTNQPAISFSKMRKPYEVGTLLGVTLGSFMTSKDHAGKFPFINPQIRPVHSWAQLGETNASDVKLPVWVKISPRLKQAPIQENDFRLEIAKTMKQDGRIEYDVFAADQLNSDGVIQWQAVGKIFFTEAILAAGVDQNMLFPHDTLNSAETGKNFDLPAPLKRLN